MAGDDMVICKQASGSGSACPTPYTQENGLCFSEARKIIDHNPGSDCQGLPTACQSEGAQVCTKDQLNKWLAMNKPRPSGANDYGLAWTWHEVQGTQQFGLWQQPLSQW
eukprot:CAMPEP_0197622212 /NCGR_PEP_ID=MMETSP1338-20131121/2584_1 /TAXON_ID=43686 ORGANISM="Pelagodinium beii, Strain RCC1491" /NCGR_SAMPLE_ID=MMETSP1338 /ASSEMBLY_ACC=CAM_ASM_000754 /LENGTH=108 /DNA_ID=CAMNT_0043191891 /DNA_START=6 /DNA_END=329 /DNA_ORIENTATION=+